MGTLNGTTLHQHDYAAGGSGVTYTIALVERDTDGQPLLDGLGDPIPYPLPAGARVIVRAYGGSQQTYRLTDGSGTALTRRAQALSAIDVSIHDVVAAGGETAIHVTLVGDENVTTVIDVTDLGAYIGGSSNGTGSSSGVGTDFQATVSTAVTVTGAAALVSAFGWQGATAFDATTSFRNHGPLGELDVSFGHQPASGTKHIGAGGIADIDAGHSYPVSVTAGQYKATSTWVQAGTVYAAQALYTAGPTPMVGAYPNQIVGENTIPGTFSGNWYLGTGNNTGSIAGFTDSQSYQPGDTVSWKVDSAATAYTVEVFRTGHYGWESLGARRVVTLSDTAAAQPTPVVDPVLGSASCAAWSVTSTWTVPADTPTGFYFYIIRLASNTAKVCGGWFIVRPSSLAGKAVVVMPDLTYQAYNIHPGTLTANGSRAGGGWEASGRSLYTSGGTTTDVFADRAYAVAFDRPWATPAMQPNTGPWDSDYGTIHFLEAQGIDVAYVSDMDVHRDPALLTTAGLVVLLGHHEYWTESIYDGMRNVQAAGVPMLICSSNTALWRVRFDPADTAHRTVICYKESGTRDVTPGFTGTGYDPSSEWTGTWRDTTAANGKINPDVRRENELTGQLFRLSAPVNEQHEVPFASKTKPLYRNHSAVQALTSGGVWTAPFNTIGDEADSADGSTGQPANLVNLGPTPISGTTGANAAGTVYTTSVSITAGITMHLPDQPGSSPVANFGSWRGGWGLTRWRASSLQTYTGASDVSADWQNTWLALLHDLGAVAQTLRPMRPGLDTAITDPATGAPVGTLRDIARAYGLEAVGGNGFFF